MPLKPACIFIVAFSISGSVRSMSIFWSGPLSTPCWRSVDGGGVGLGDAPDSGIGLGEEFADTGLDVHFGDAGLGEVGG